MTENNTRQFIQKLAQREGVSNEKIQEIIKTAFRNSYCQNDNEEAVLHFEFNHGLVVYRLYRIVEKVANPHQEITRESTLFKEGEVKDEVLFWPVDTKKFSFTLSQEIKKHLAYDLEKIQKEKEYEVYSPQQGQIISGHLQSIEHDYYVINLGKGRGYWEKNEQPFWGGKLRSGQKLTFLLKEVKKEGNGSRIILTRCGELFLRKVLELEIPEIKEQIIVIRDILTFPGFLNKVIIESKNPYLNVVGTCIGKDACRMRSILPTIYPERMEMIKWEENKEKLFFKLLAPVEVIKLVENGNDWEVIVAPEKTFFFRQGQEEIIQKISKYLEKNIQVRILSARENLTERGKIVKLLANNVRILQEINEKQ